MDEHGGFLEKAMRACLGSEMNNELIQHKSEVTRPTRYKYQRLRERLRQAVLTGELVGKLPGERALATRYNANAKTVNKALSDLTTEGLLVRHVGRGTFVAGDQPHLGHSPGKHLRFAWLSTTPGSNGELETLFNLIDNTLTELNHRIDRVSPQLDEAGAISGRTIPPSLSRDLDGVVLYESTASVDLLADLHRRHVPTILINATQDQLKLASVMPDYSQGAFELCEQHVRLGHRRIRLVVGSEMRSAVEQAEMGYRAAMSRHGLRAEPIVRVDADIDWAALLRTTANGPTALVCLGSKLAAESIQHGMDLGLTTPAMLSINAMAAPGDTTLDARSITGYEFLPERVSHWTVDLLLTASPGQLPRTVIVPGQLHDRGSAAPPTREETRTAQPQESVV